MSTARRRSGYWFAALVAVLASCGSGSSGGSASASATFSGTIAGTPFTPQDALSITYQGARGVTLTSGADTCSDLMQATLLRNEQLFELAIPPRTGQFIVGSGASVLSFSLDASCQPIQSSYHVGHSGTVTINAYSSASVAGSFDVVMDTGDHVSGTFNAPACDFTPPAADGGSLHCQ